MIKRKMKKGKFIALGAFALLIGGLIAGNIIVKQHDVEISIFLNSLAEEHNDEEGGQSSESGIIVKTAGTQLCSDIEEEGAVLLKNDIINTETGARSLPLTKRTKQVNVFGFGATDTGWIISGVGSGRVYSSSKTVKFLKSIKNAGYSYNPELIDEISSLGFSGKSNMSASFNYDICDASRAFYENRGDLLKNAKAYSDTAIYVISRTTGENTSNGGWSVIPSSQKCVTESGTQTNNNRCYMQLTDVEDGVINLLHENFKNVVLVINSASAMILDRIDNRVQSVIYAGITGDTGASALPNLIWGKKNFSGHSSDTLIKIPSADSTYANRNNLSASYNSGGKPDKSPLTMQEGIYFGYKWFETADAEGFFDSSFAKEKWKITNGYDDVVFRPFGYGMSYTTFDWNIKSSTISDGEEVSDNKHVTLEIDVSNTGTVAGKEVVQIYGTAPYTKGQIEKASTNLLAFEKTPELEPGKQTTIKLEFDMYDLASFDTYDANSNGFKGYELDGGEYKIELKTDAHTLKDCEKNTISFKVKNDGIKFENDPVTGKPVSVRFSGENAYKSCPIDGKGVLNNDVTYLSRNNFTSTFATKVTDGSYPSSGRASEAGSSNASDYYNYTSMPITGEKNNLYLLTKNDGSKASLSDLKGGGSLKANAELMNELMDFDNPKWEKLLNELTADELVDLVYFGGHQTAAVESVGKPKTNDVDASSGFHNPSSKVYDEWTAYPCEVIIGSTFSKRLCYTLGLSLGMEATKANYTVHGVYGCGVNLHRSPYGTRNYEYFSEDRVLSGYCGANYIKGTLTNGLYSYLKHFVCDQLGPNPYDMTTWMTEQSLREEYSRAFEIVVKNSPVNAIMTSFNRVGNVYNGHNYELLNGMVRGEWGFKGAMLTDYYNLNTYMRPDYCVYAGNDFLLNPNTSKSSITNGPLSTSNVTQMNCARTAAKNILYLYVSTYVYSNTHEAENESFIVDNSVIRSGSELTSWGGTAVLVIDIIVGITFALTMFAYFYPRPRIVNEDGTLTPTEKEIKIKQGIKKYMPLGLALISLIVSFIGLGYTKTGYFKHFFSGLFVDIGSAFVNIANPVLMNVIVYIFLILLAGIVYSSVKLIKKNENTLPIIIEIGITVASWLMLFISIGTLLHMLTVGKLFVVFADTVFVVTSFIAALLGFILQTIKFIKMLKQ